MAESEVNSPAIVTQEYVDVDMETSAADAEVGVTGSNAVENGDALPFAAEEEEENDVKEPIRLTYLDYLASPIVQLNVTEGDNTTVLSAHEALLKKSPFFLEACAQFGPTAVSSTSLPDRTITATN